VYPTPFAVIFKADYEHKETQITKVVSAREMLYYIALHNFTADNAIAPAKWSFKIQSPVLHLPILHFPKYWFCKVRSCFFRSSILSAPRYVTGGIIQQLSWKYGSVSEIQDGGCPPFGNLITSHEAIPALRLFVLSCYVQIIFSLSLL